MEAERRRQASQLYHAALLKAIPDRPTFVRDACGDDDELRQEVESLLAWDSKAQNFMNTPAPDRARATADGPQMSLIGRQLGPYRVDSLLGAGGMGEVYRAHDTKLGRDIAIKILPRLFGNDEERLARFEREARTLASLNHPHIGAIYGFEHVDGVPMLVLELVDGVTLAARLANGPPPVRDALKIAQQIADALEAAHEKGIVHRDLKPANVKITPDGTIKVLDFGLARVVAPASEDAPVLTAMSSHPGIIVGTPAYMSPEQARGEAAGRQADIWSFGVVLYELLTGASPFSRTSTAEALASVLGTQPDFSVLPPDTPANARHLLRRCLEKDPKRRFQHMGDVRIEIEEALAEESADARAPELSRANRKLPRAAGAIAMAVLAGVAGWFLANRVSRSPAVAPGAVVRLSISSERPTRGPYGVRNLAISADGARIAYTAANRLWIRRLDQKDPVVVDVNASNPFFSDDGEWVGFFGETSGETGLNKVPAVGGAPVSLVTTTERPGGGTWRADGTIVFATSGGLYQVSENGGDMRRLVSPESRRKERAFAWPELMPGGQSVLFTIVSSDSIEGAQIALLDLNTLETRIVVKGGSAAHYASTGHLVYASGPTLKAIAFDPNTKQTRGDSVALPDIEIANTPDNGAADFAVSATGTLLFTTPDVAGQLEPQTLSWVDHQGKEEPLPLAPGQYLYLRVSPDAARVAIDVAGANRDIWILNLQRNNLTKLTNGPTEDMLPLWSRDGRRVFFASDRNGNFDIYSQAADGATMDRVEYAAPGMQAPNSFASDGTRLVVFESGKGLSILNLARPQLEPLLHNEFINTLGEVSPDGNWIAYESNESGRTEIFVRPFPNVSERREKVSVEGGRYPVWGPKGSGELFYVDPSGAMMAATVEVSPTLRLGGVTKLFDWQPPPRGITGRRYDISPIDGRFLVPRRAQGSAARVVNISVVLNWLEELKRLVPTPGW